MNVQEQSNLVTLDMTTPLWDRVFTVAPLVVVGTKGGGEYDLAPKHMAMPIGFSNFFGFVCTPRHCTYSNVIETGVFSVSFPTPDQLIATSLSASPRTNEISKSEGIISTLPTIKAKVIDALMIDGAYLYLECECYKIINGFDNYGIITGRVKAMHVQKEYLRVSEEDEQEQLMKNPLLAYIANGRFAEIRDTYNFPFPKDFKR